jgi:hypothetical protein
MPDQLEDQLIQRSTYTSPLQKWADVASIPFGGPVAADWITNKLFHADKFNYEHPKDERAGSVENLIKSLGMKYGSLVPPDLRYLEQYVHPNRDVLPKTEKPPGRPGTLPYREPDYSDTGKANESGLGAHGIVNPETGYPEPWVETKLGEGAVKHGPPPTSTHVFDVWDFKTPAGMIKDAFGGMSNTGDKLGELVKLLLQRAGKPYAVFGPAEKPYEPSNKAAGTRSSRSGSD